MPRLEVTEPTYVLIDIDDAEKLRKGVASPLPLRRALGVYVVLMEFHTLMGLCCAEFLAICVCGAFIQGVVSGWDSS